jgi:Tfp pilus assembly protein PilF
MPLPKENEKHRRAMEFFHQGYECQMRCELEKAIQSYCRSIALFPTAESHTFLGWTYSFQGKYEAAIEECLKAIEVDPTFGNPYNDIGAYLFELGQLNEAIPWFDRALRAPRYESYCFPHFNLGRVYEKKRMYAQALAEYKKALQENRRHLSSFQAIRRLQGMLN